MAKNYISYIPFDKRDKDYRYKGVYYQVIKDLWLKGKELEKEGHIEKIDYSFLKEKHRDYEKTLDMLERYNVIVTAPAFLEKNNIANPTSTYVNCKCVKCGYVKSPSLADLFQTLIFDKIENPICTCPHIPVDSESEITQQDLDLDNLKDVSTLTESELESLPF